MIVSMMDAHLAPVAPQATRVLDAALTCVGRVGLSKTTLDDVAREAGCARATVYRHFPSKQHLIAALVEREVATFQRQLLTAAEGAESLGDAVTRVMTTGAGALLRPPVLTFLAAYEPEVLLPYLAFERESAVLGAAAQLVAPAFEPFLPIDRATQLGEWVARITLSYLCCPSDHVDVHDALQVRALVDDFVLPGFLRPAGALEGMKT
jgi:AcrR family transcriptional regulator